MGAGNYSLVATVVTGDTITASERNSEHTNHINNHDFPGLDDYSSNASQMQTATDPYPASSESLATSGAGEVERIRYQIKAILQAIGSTATQWYHIAPTASVFAIGSAGAGIAAAKKLFLDGVALTGNTYFIEGSADTVTMTVGGTDVGIFTSGGIGVFTGRKLFVDGGGDSYWIESSADIVKLFVGAVDHLTATGGDVYTDTFTDYAATSTVVGWSAFTTKAIRYKKLGKKMSVWFDLNGTSDATTASFTLPYNVAAGVDINIVNVRTVDNGTAPSTVGRARMTAGAATVTLDLTNAAAGGWTGSGDKRVSGQFEYQAA